MSHQPDYRHDFLKQDEKQLKRPHQTLDLTANICAYILLVGGISQFIAGLMKVLTMPHATGLLIITFILMGSILVFSLTQMTRIIFRKVVWTQDTKP